MLHVLQSTPIFIAFSKIFIVWKNWNVFLWQQCLENASAEKGKRVCEHGSCCPAGQLKRDASFGRRAFLLQELTQKMKGRKRFVFFRSPCLQSHPHIQTTRIREKDGQNERTNNMPGFFFYSDKHYYQKTERSDCFMFYFGFFTAPLSENVAPARHIIKKHSEIWMHHVPGEKEFWAG